MKFGNFALVYLSFCLLCLQFIIFPFMLMNIIEASLYAAQPRIYVQEYYAYGIHIYNICVQDLCTRIYVHGMHVYNTVVTSLCICLQNVIVSDVCLWCLCFTYVSLPCVICKYFMRKCTFPACVFVHMHITAKVPVHIYS